MVDSRAVSLKFGHDGGNASLGYLRLLNGADNGLDQILTCRGWADRELLRVTCCLSFHRSVRRGVGDIAMEKSRRATGCFSRHKKQTTPQMETAGANTENTEAGLGSRSTCTTGSSLVPACLHRVQRGEIGVPTCFLSDQERGEILLGVLSAVAGSDLREIMSPSTCSH